MPTKTIPLVGNLTGRSLAPLSNTTKDQRFENCIYEIVQNPLTGGRSSYLHKRPGFTSSVLADSGYTGTPGAISWSGYAAAASNTFFAYTIAGGTNRVQVWGIGGTQLGADITTSNGCSSLNETMISNVANMVAICLSSATSGLSHAHFFPEGGAWTEITDVQYPSKQTPALKTVGRPVFLDGYMFIMDEFGVIWNSDLNSLANWTASSFIASQRKPDKGAGLASYKGIIASFGTAGVEFFHNAGNATGSPLSPVPNAISNVGSYSNYANNGGIQTIFPFDDTVYFIGQEGRVGGRRIYRLNGYQAEAISNGVVDRILSDPTNASAGILGGLNIFGMNNIFFYLNSATEFLAYCIPTGQWWYPVFGNSVIPSAFIGAGLQTQSMTTFSNRNRYTYSTNTTSNFQDDASAYSLKVQTAGMDFNTDDRKFVSDIWLDADTQASGTALLEASDDDYATWTSLGVFDLTKHEKRITRCGSHKGERAYRLTHSSNTAFRGRSLRIKYAVAT